MQLPIFLFLVSSEISLHLLFFYSLSLTSLNLIFNQLNLCLLFTTFRHRFLTSTTQCSMSLQCLQNVCSSSCVTHFHTLCECDDCGSKYRNRSSFILSTFNFSITLNNICTYALTYERNCFKYKFTHLNIHRKELPTRYSNSL